MQILKEFNYFFSEKLPSLVKAKIHKNGIYARWGKYINFGDQLTPILLKYYGFTPIYSNYNPSYGHKSELVCVGTALQNTPENFSGIILGSGMDNVLKNFENAKILGVRGKLTLNNLGLDNNNIVIGDPGLLVSYLFPKKLEKKWKLGIIPHFVDKNESLIEKWKNKFTSDVKIIDVQRSPEEVVSDIKQCEHIISSSLHGLITADTFNIPNIMFTIRHENRQKNDDYKFMDYYSGLNIDLKFIEPTGTETLEYLLSLTTFKGALVKEMKENLHVVFLDLVNIYKDHIS